MLGTPQAIFWVGERDFDADTVVLYMERFASDPSRDWELRGKERGAFSRKRGLFQ
jgi:SRSO17 transposase